MHFHSMEVFLSVLDTGSFGGAARQTFMTQPAVSMVITSLEKELEKKLLIRGSGQRSNVLPTAEGKRFAEFARRTLKEYWVMRDAFELENEERTLVIGTSPTPGSSIVPRVVSSFKESRPNSRIQVCVYRGYELRQLLAERKIDCAITGIEWSHYGENYIRIPFFADPMILVSSPRVHDASPLTINQLKKLPLIVRNMDCNTMQLLAGNLEKLGTSLKEMNVVLQVYGNSDVLNQVKQGYGAGFVVRSSMEGNSDAAGLNIVPVKKLDIFREVSIIYPRDEQDFQLLQSFSRYICSAEWREGKFSYNTFPGASAPRN